VLRVQPRSARCGDLSSSPNGGVCQKLLFPALWATAQVGQSREALKYQ